MMEKQPLFGRLFIEQSFFRLQFHYHFLFFFLLVNKKLLRSKIFFGRPKTPAGAAYFFLQLVRGDLSENFILSAIAAAESCR